jgi:hypothetical protein
MPMISNTNHRSYYSNLSIGLLMGIAVMGCDVGGGEVERDYSIYDNQRGDPSLLEAGNAAYNPTLQVPSCDDFATECSSGSLLMGRANLGPEPNAPNTLAGACADGAYGQYHADESVDQVRVYTADGSYLEAGTTVTVEALVFPWTYSASSDRIDLYYTADTDAPNWQLIATLTPATSGQQTLSADYTIPAGGTEMHAVRAIIRYQGSVATCATGSFDDNDDLAFKIGAPDLEPPAVAFSSHVDGDRGKGKTIVVADASDNVGVTQVEILVDGTSLATLAAPPYAAVWDTSTFTDGAHTVSVVASDAAGNQGTAEIQTTVHNLDGAGNSLYDAPVSVPACHAAGSICDSGDLLLGRGLRGPGGGTEPNYPNTLGGSCADGDFGVYRSGEQLDRIAVYTQSGEPMSAGATVVIEATVWADYSDYLDDSLDLYYTGDIANPSWQYLTTIVPEDGDAQVLSTTFTLPQGGLQAVRGVFRWAGSASPCTPAGWTDHDDVVFMVAE